ncbi:hypothetical protein [Cetobacterium sp. ZOR0034]|uniref:hypothetical protein n=1 Tax=Cetobacterium sp. ZOR0034 TaxID=1339239 RepID=UPI000645C70D|nr:hypothetical protein [Cetobacterium sp. ZOR0034]
MRNYSKLRCPNSFHQELKRFAIGTQHFFLKREIEFNIQLKKINLNDSFETVNRYSEEYGGKTVYGISLLESDIIFEAESFAVWESPNKTLHHITSRYNENILFIPNDNPYEIPVSVGSRFKNLFYKENKSCISNFIWNKMNYQSLLRKINPILTKDEKEIVNHYRDLFGLEYNTNNAIEADIDLKNKILEQIKK